MKLQEITLGSFAFLLLPLLSLAECSAPANQQFKPFSGGENKPASHFEWYSAAAPNPVQGGGHPSHVFERRVKNLANATLKYNWVVGRMHNDALPAGMTDHFCYEYQWPNQADGPLNYGRGNDETKTTVWEGKDEPETNAIWATFTFNIESFGSTQTVSMRVLTSFRRTVAGTFSYNFAFERVPREGVTLQWGIEKDRSLLANLKNKQMSAVFLVDGKKEILFDSSEEPTVGFRSLNVIVDGKRVAGVEVPMIIPGKT